MTAAKPVGQRIKAIWLDRAETVAVKACQKVANNLMLMETGEGQLAAMQCQAAVRKAIEELRRST